MTYYDHMFAIAIEACGRCGGLYFPGDELVETIDGLVHAETCVRTRPRILTVK